MKSLEQQITEISEQVRGHLETRACPSLPGTPFDGFPIACCSASSLILRDILNQSLPLNAKVVIFDRSEEILPDSHAWVEAEGLCIDITIDQFNSDSAIKYPSVYVGPPLDLHNDYKRGRSEAFSNPKWLNKVVEDLSKIIGQ